MAFLLAKPHWMPRKVLPSSGNSRLGGCRRALAISVPFCTTTQGSCPLARMTSTAVGSDARAQGFNCSTQDLSWRRGIPCLSGFS